MSGKIKRESIERRRRKAALKDRRRARGNATVEIAAPYLAADHLTQTLPRPLERRQL